MLKPKFTHAGFGLIEVLIAVVVVSIGLLGLASLQNKTIQSVQEGDNLVSASIIAQEMAKRMISNRYMTAQGRQGYLALDLTTDIATAGGVVPWATGVQTSNPDMINCYSSDNTESCFASGATYTNSSDHINALTNMMLMDQVEMRLLAWNALPQGQIKICFDSTGAKTTWACDNVATRVASRNENVFTVKVQWTNLLTNTSQMYSLQFTAECDNSSSTYCG